MEPTQVGSKTLKRSLKCFQNECLSMKKCAEKECANETLLMPYQSECLSALKSIANIHEPFEKMFMDTIKIFIAIPNRINFSSFASVHL